LSGPVHDYSLEFCACGADGPLKQSSIRQEACSRETYVEARVKRARSVEVSKDALERTCCREVGKERRVLPVGQACQCN
jgi:hypothetical protein